ncbi:hypothetical protein AGLY_010618 [Aphis glycines]|uniref:Uncharacterized protein n=1 Tax=Aphis glycines TaxID=307491 RepID=A0A6G0TE27_APHGL|nr:hypothetical protein AGLY_010618 [Aphis glycines]
MSWLFLMHMGVYIITYRPCLVHVKILYYRIETCIKIVEQIYYLKWSALGAQRCETHDVTEVDCHVIISFSHYRLSQNQLTSNRSIIIRSLTNKIYFILIVWTTTFFHPTIQIPGRKKTFIIKISYFNLIEFDLLGITIIAFYWEYIKCKQDVDTAGCFDSRDSAQGFSAILLYYIRNGFDLKTLQVMVLITFKQRSTATYILKYFKFLGSLIYFVPRVEYTFFMTSVSNGLLVYHPVWRDKHFEVHTTIVSIVLGFIIVHCVPINITKMLFYLENFPFSFNVVQSFELKIL